MKLTERPVPGGGRRPFLTFICRGPNLHMVQDLPVSRPHGPGEVDALLASHKGGGTDSQGARCPLYLDLLPMAPRLLARAAQRTAMPSIKLLMMVMDQPGSACPRSGLFELEIRAVPTVPGPAAHGAAPSWRVSSSTLLRHA